MSVRAEVRLAARCLRALPLRIALFLIRARLRALRSGDRFSVDAAARPEKLAAVLRHAAGRREIVELGTGTGWATIALALADPARRIATFDPFDRDRERYLALAPARVRSQIRFIPEPGERGPDPDASPPELLFIDSSHLREPTVAEYRAWLPHLAQGALVIFDDYGHPDWPGVQEAVEELALAGEVEADLFVHRP